MKIAIKTLGCKLNQYETQLMIEDLTKEGHEIVDFEDMANFYIINSCAVTAKASKESRLLAKSAAKRGRVVYTGCDSYLEEKLKDRFILAGNSYKHKIIKLIKNPINDISDETKTYPLERILSQYRGKSRAFVKIQEGCNNHCTYCIISFLRGRERDKEKDKVLSEIESLAKAGFSEIVLTGTNIGSYRDLKGLLRDIDALEGDFRVRISSIEPMYVDKEFIDIVASGRFANHLHIPLQSGSNKILKLMGRNYKREHYEKIVNYCHKKGVFVGCDIIVGFFGETDELFEETYWFVKRLPLSYAHVFSYSKRPNTPAYNLKLDLPKGPVVRQRNRKLRELFEQKKKNSIKQMIGKEVEFIIETTQVNTQKGRFYKAITSQYFPVLVDRYDTGLKIGILKEFDGRFGYVEWAG
ncbi:tRNA (N(6)-L-threonylcarbamoyladenosine(37)-C(2))-methylthiotransferase MtaB [Hippea maritima]|uniref:MiaB-like tRNA modifying enzyme n=1 Tax=Hippea maritima (strain ATCC 700847 / DSM 10411 / MH2) TaxID=760142 RepID=F2LX93_HIPMA|nr:tRNA (N(6)-L-threonylcarbamoyladenosine(37)-C(2))-methylthiotransferase MtaB [Hippea maritima]AEA33151.1 MiaB-like tRNA modifying enzyme [Hippea maritima DSM 10411]